ncbi:ComEC/Rec2 family competence protein [Algoriphagus namhaensis]|uniref:ComEC/Rec2 family competence protein n=1 Tax=Algoriphagus namhaensis TaxID=915353 RepID=A0ABV8AQF7_9BACT
MQFSNFPFLRYLPFFVGGVLLSEALADRSWIILLLCSASAWLIYLVFLYKSNRKSTFKLSLWAYLLLFLIGAGLALHQQEYQSKRLSVEFLNNPKGYLGEVQEYDLEKPNSWENLIHVTHVFQEDDWIPTDRKILIYHTLGDSLIPGNVVLVQGEFDPIPPTNGPKQFDYKGWLGRQGVSGRHFARQDVKVLAKGGEDHLAFFVKRVRHDLASEIEEVFTKPETIAIAKALLLGEKRSLDPETRSAYGQAGVMHILAVSGLHVGIVYALFLFLANSVKLKGMVRKFYFFGVVLFLWFYAALTGFSPSVIRASCMFSLLIFGQIQNRKPPTFNILAFSAMLMIAVNPSVIFDVGFQLSYLAVGGIVLLQPLILDFCLPKNRVLEYIWQLMTVSIAAQLATFPLSVYYFHYFPTYFLLGNLIVLPLAFVIMQIGVPWLILMKIPFLGKAMAWFLNLLIDMQNGVIEYLTMIPGGKLDRLTISPPLMLLIWILLLLWAGWKELPKRALIRTGLYSSTLLLSWYLLMTGLEPKEEILIYPDAKGVLVDHYHSGGLNSFNAGFAEEQISFVADPYRLAKGVGLVPETMKALKNGNGELYFHDLDLLILNDSSQSQIVINPSHRTEAWENGEWSPNLSDQEITLGSRAIRILP